MTKMLDGIGTSATRREDSRFVRGAGRYTDDLAAAGDLTGLFIRAEVAHGRILSATLDEARAVPGVVAILTGEDAAADGGQRGCDVVCRRVREAELESDVNPGAGGEARRAARW